MLSARGIVAGYTPGTPVLNRTDLDLAPGEVLGLAGPSGSGKSTLARVLTFLVRPWEGEVWLDGTQVTAHRYRVPREVRTAVGVVFQSPRRSVDPRLTLRDVIVEPLRVARLSSTVRAERLSELVALVGLTSPLLGRLPSEVSDGQLQRACLARALAMRPRYLVCDEMTSMLDAPSAARLVTSIRDVVDGGGLGVLMISHDERLLRAAADRVDRLEPSSLVAGSTVATG